MDINKKWLLIILLACVIYQPLGVFLIPGLVIFFADFCGKRNIFEKILLAITISLSYWIICSWWIKDILKLTTFFYATFAISLIYIIIQLFKNQNNKVTTTKKELLILALFLVVGLIRLYPMTQMIVAPGPGDSSEHAYPTRLIIENNGIPNSYRPLLPIDHFGTYAAGFHTISALITLLDPAIPLYRATFFLSCLIYALIQLAIFVFLSRFFSIWTSFLTSLFALFFTTYPQLIFHWGGNPTSFSFYFALVGIYLLYELNNWQKIEFLNCFILSLILIASLLTHSNPAVSLFYIYIIVFLVYHFKNIKKETYLNLLAIIIFATLLISPYLIDFELGLSENEIAELKQKPIDHAVWLEGFGIFNYLLYAPFQFIGYTSIPFIILSMMGFFFLKRMEKKYVLALIIGIILLLINVLFQKLPLTIALMPDRISLFAIIPLSICIAGLFSKISKKIISSGILILFGLGYIIYASSPDFAFSTSPYNTDRTSMTPLGITKMAIFQTLGGSGHLFIFGMKEDSWVSKEDLETFEWIENNIPKETLILNYPGTGVWIPAIAYRHILLNHVPVNLKYDIINYYNLTKFMICDEDYSTAYVCKFDFDKFIRDKNNLIDTNITYTYYKSMPKEYNLNLELPDYYYELPIVFNLSNIEIRRVK